MRRIKAHVGSIMLQTSLLFLHTAEADKEYAGELESRPMKVSPFPSFFVAIIVICFLIIILGLIGNGIVLWLLCCTIKMTKFTVYVANLAAADCLILLHYLVANVLFSAPFYGLHITLVSLISSSGTNIYFLTVLTVERYASVYFPVWNQRHRPKYLTAFVCIILWALSLILSLLEHFFCYEPHFALNSFPFPCKIELILQSAIIAIILTFIILFSSLALFIRMQKKTQHNLPAKLDTTIMIAVALHLIFSGSIGTMEIINYVYFKYSPKYYLILILYCLASSVNPFVYLLVGCWKRGKTQEPFYMFLERALRDESDSGSLTTQPPQEQA